MEKQASQDVTNKEQEKFLKKSDPWYYTKVGPMNCLTNPCNCGTKGPGYKGKLGPWYKEKLGPGYIGKLGPVYNGKLGPGLKEN